MAQIVTPYFTLSYPFITKADEHGKYRLAMVFPAGTDLSAMEEAATASWHGKFPNKPMPKGGNSWPFAKAETKDAYMNNERFKGAVIVNAKTDTRPQVVDNKGQLIPEAQLDQYVYPGAVFRAAVNPFSYSNASVGTSFGLNHLQFVRHGERLDSRKSALETFTPLDDGEVSMADLMGE